MDQKKENRKRRVKSYRGIFLIFIAVCTVVSLFSFQYYKNLHATIREESKGYLQEVSRRVGENLDRIIADNFSMLYMMRASLEIVGTDSPSDLQPLIRAQQTYWDYENILLVDKNGKAYDINDSKSTFMSLDDALRSDMLSQKRAMATTQMVNNREYLVFSVPFENFSLGGVEVIALAATYDPASLDTVLSMTSFDDQAYSQIITKTGTVVTRSGSPYAIKSGYNIFSTLQKAQLDQGVTIEKMQQEIQEDMEGQISLQLDGEHRYMVYTPIQPDEWYLLTFVPFQTVNAKSDMLLKTTLVICGLIVLTFCGLVAALLYVFTANRKKLERIAYVDVVTGGNTIQRFYELVQEALDTAAGKQYALVFSNIENFKVLNAQLGRKNCDILLKHFYKYTVSTLIEPECMGRFTGDNFCILMEYTEEKALLSRLEKWGLGAEVYFRDLQAPWKMPMIELGVYVIENASLPFTEMIDRAKLALKESPRPITGKLRYAFYDDTVRRQLFREKQLSDMADSALANQEFRLYLQPKYRLPEEKIGGAEALVRWVSASEGMIFPNEFIPLFEKNGYIVQVDLWIFEEVCRTVRSWIDRGLEPIKVSVNCSRVHFKDPNFLLPYIRLAAQYGIEKDLIEIELTESVVFENTDHLIKIIQEIRSAGFGCSMDDFGSGYSSLNLIQSIPVDTLKIDKIFFQRSFGEPERTEAVVASIVRMAKSLSLTTVAEGVEYREQVDMLKRVQCDYIQGYIFAKPMEVSAFEQLAYGSEIE